MHRLLTLSSLLLFLVSSVTVGASAQALFFDALKDQKAGRQAEAEKKFKQCLIDSEAENLPNYLASSAKNLAFAAYDRSDGEATLHYGKLALEIHNKSREQNEPWSEELWARTSRIMSAGMVERGHFLKGQLGSAWQGNHATAKVWLEEAGLSSAQNPFDPKNLSTGNPEFQRLGARVFEREAEYLHYVGRTREAITLLEGAVAAINPTPGDPSFYYYQKLLGKLAGIYGFIGEEEKAVVILRRQVALLGDGRRDRWSSLVAQTNLLAERNDLHELTEEDYLAAKEIERKCKAFAPDQLPSIKRVLAQVYSSFESREERLQLLQDAADDPRAIENFYARRDAIFELSLDGDEVSQSDFTNLLMESRKIGNKRAEPRIFRKYGDWLTLNRRWSEARAAYGESLRMSLAFDWDQRPPALRERLARLLLLQGDLASARQAWAEADRLMDLESDLLPRNRNTAWRIRIFIQLRAGLVEEARALAQITLAHGIAHSLPLHFTEDFQPANFEALAKVLGEIGFELSPEVATVSQAVVTLSPRSVRTIAEPGIGRATFYLSNPTESATSGKLSFASSSTVQSSVNELGGLTIRLGEDGSTTQGSSAITLDAGEMREIFLEAGPTTERDADGFAHLNLEWKRDDDETLAKSEWEIAWGEEAAQFSVLEAAHILSNPFAAMPVHHQFALPEGTAEVTPIRVRLLSDRAASVHIEYRSPVTGELLAADCNGDGDFLDSGDFSLPTSDQTLPAGPQVFATGSTHQGSIEIWLSDFVSVDSSTPHHLVLEYFRDGKWIETGRDTIQ